MRNFKKILSLVLCMAMMLSVMVVGAGAAFKDQNQIKNTEAVDMCVALNIINGYTDGSFKPEGTITRAEACKMICVALNGGKEPVLGTSASASFTDTKGHWAEQYIESCVAQGIVAGVGGGKFAPNATVTGSQFAKMLLIALGYNADNEGYVGSAWEINVNVQATAKGLYEDLETMDPSVALTRDNAAQMVWNALQAVIVEYDYTLVSNNGTLTSQIVVKDDKDGTTLLEDKYDGEVIEGTLNAFKYDSNKEEWTYTVYVKGIQGENGYSVVMKSSTDFTALLNQDVKAVYDSTGKAPYDAYGIFANDSEVVLTGIIADLPDIAAGDKSFKIDGVKYNLDAAAETIDVKVFNDSTSTAKKLTAVAAEDVTTYDAQAFTAIDVDGDGDIDYLMVVPYAVAEVKYVNSDKFKVDVIANPFNIEIPSDKTYEFDDVNAYDGLAKNDYVTIVAAANTADDTDTFAKADLVAGKIVSKDGTDVSVDGTWYTVDKSYVDAGIAYTAGTTLKDAVVVNGFIFDADASGTKDIDEYAVVIKCVASASNGLNGNQAKLLFSDGTKKVVDTDQGYTYSEGTLVTFDINSDDEYELTKASVTGTGFDKAIGSATYGGTYGGTVSKISNSSEKAGYIDGEAIADDAVIFVKDTEKANDIDYKVITGEQLKKSVASDLTCTYMLASDGTGNVKNVEMAYVTASSDIGNADTYYGYVTSVLSIEDAYEITVWTENGSQTYETKDDSTQFASVSKRDVIEFKVNSDGEMSQVLAKVNVATATKGTAFDNDYACTIGIVNWSNDTLRFKAFAADKITGTQEFAVTNAGKYFEADDDMVTLYIENTDAKGLESGTIDEADDAITENTLTPNAFVVWDKDGSILLMVYDVDNDINK